MKTPENFCGLFYLYDLCVCYVFHLVCDILSGRSLNVVGDDERANIYGKFLNIQKIKDVEMALLISARAKTRIRRGRVRYFHPEKC